MTCSKWENILDLMLLRFLLITYNVLNKETGVYSKIAILMARVANMKRFSQDAFALDKAFFDGLTEEVDY